MPNGNQLRDVAENVRRETEIPTSVADMERILAAIQRNGEIWAVVDLAKRPFNLVVAAVKRLASVGLVDLGGQVRLTDEGRELAKKRGIGQSSQARCSECAGRGIDPSSLGAAGSRFQEMVQGRPSAVVDYDQAAVTVETVLGRLAFMADRGDLAGKDLIVLGDDDLMGLAAALTGLPRRVVVLEIDPRLVEFIGGVAAREDLHVEVIAHDLRDQLPERLIGQFHTFVTDPPETLAGLELFVSRAVSGLGGPGCAGYFGLGLVEASLSKWRALQKYLLGRDENLVITDLIEDFNVYTRWGYLAETVPGDIAPLRVAPSYDWYKTALCRVELLPQNSDLERRMKGENPYLDRESLIWTQRGVKNAAGT